MVDWDHYRALLAQVRAIDRSKSEIGLYPPATDEQIRETEERIGFALPPALRMLYQEVGNGGDIFGDGTPISGAIGGYPQFPQDEDLYYCRTIDQGVSHSNWRLNERVTRALRQYPGAYIETEEYPDRFIDLGGIPGTIVIKIDGWTGTLYSSGVGQSVDSYYARLGLPPPRDYADAYMQVMDFLASSLEEWIAVMLDGGWSATFRRHQYRPLEQWMLE